MSQDVFDNWVDLHHHSAYSPLDAIPFPADVIRKAASLGRPAVALTDHGSVSGHVLFEKAIEGQSTVKIGANTMQIRGGEKIAIKPIFGVEAYMTLYTDPERRQQRKNHITILSQTQAGYRSLNHLVSDSYAEGYYYRPTVSIEMMRNHKDGLLFLSGCESSYFLRQIAAGDKQAAYEYALAMKREFGARFVIEIQHFPHQREMVLDAYEIALAADIPVVLTCDVHYLEPDDKYEQQLLYSIRDRKPVDEMEFCMHHAHPWEPMALYQHVTAHLPELPWMDIFANTAALAADISDYRLPRAPHVIFPYDGDKIAYVRDTCRAYLRELGHGDEQAYEERLLRELSVIDDKGYVDYFLVVADVVRWAKANGIYVGPARGSAAGSLVCYGLRITEIDPMEWGLMFERFVDPTRVDLPDIDVDFEDERRADVIAYLRMKYGTENVTNISTFARFGGRSTLDDIARSYKIPYWAIDVVKSHLVERSSGDQRAEFTIEDALKEPEVQAVWEQFPALQYAAKIQGKVRNTGKHAAGIIVTSQPVKDYMAVYTTPNTREPIVAVDWRDTAYLNLMKIDVLGLKELSIIRLIAERVGLTLEQVYRLPLDDKATFDLFNARDYLGIFQFEGLAVRSVADRITFHSLREIADVNALARPGPLHAGATEQYTIGKERGEYKSVIEHPLVTPYLDKTYGQIVYQETVMLILREVGDMTWQDVCDIRNIMGKSKGSEAFDAYWPIWYKGTVESGKMDERNARHIWESLRLYGKHSFNASHAFAYGLLAYWSGYFKAHYPTAYYWAQLMKASDTDDERRFIHEATRKGISFAPVSLDMKTARWDVNDAGEIVPGWCMIPKIGPAIAERIIAAAPFDSVDDIVARVKGFGARSAEALEPMLGQSVFDVYGLGIWNAISQAEKQRILIQELGIEQEGILVGKVTRINKKSRLEEWTTKGKDTSRLDPNEPDEYAILTLEDESGVIMVYVSPRQYAYLKGLITESAGKFVRIAGRRAGDLKLVMVNDLKRYDVEGIIA